MLLELVKGDYRGAKKGRGGRVECKGWNLTIDFLANVLRQEGTIRVRMGSFRLLGVLLIYSSLLVELEADYRSYGSPAIAHKRAEHSALKPIDRINLRLVHHELYCAT